MYNTGLVEVYYRCRCRNSCTTEVYCRCRCRNSCTTVVYWKCCRRLCLPELSAKLRCLNHIVTVCCSMKCCCKLSVITGWWLGSVVVFELCCVQDVWLSSCGEAVWSCLKRFAYTCHHGAHEQWRSQELSTFSPAWPRGKPMISFILQVLC